MSCQIKYSITPRYFVLHDIKLPLNIYVYHNFAEWVFHEDSLQVENTLSIFFAESTWRAKANDMEAAAQLKEIARFILQCTKKQDRLAQYKANKLSSESLASKSASCLKICLQDSEEEN